MNDNSFRVVEHFVSINGEGRRAGQLAYFIRFAGCNLNCEYCDTRWANEEGVSYESCSLELLYEMITSSGIKNVTLTGGEPLIQPGMKELLCALRKLRDVRIEIETNGSIDIEPFFDEHNEFISDNVSFTLDYKTGVSGMEDMMCLKNYDSVRDIDSVKFVVGSENDMDKALEIINRFRLIDKKCGIYFSSCFGKIEPCQIVDYIKEHRLNDVNVQLQMHKYIWNPQKRGV